MKIISPFCPWLLMLCTTLGMACNKKERLAERPVSKLFIPSTLNDVQALLDNTLIINEAPGFNVISADDHYITDPSWQGLRPVEQAVYSWARDIYHGQGGIKDWNVLWQQVFYANTALEILHAIPITIVNQQQWKTLKGMALFIRGHALFNLSQVFTAAFDSNTAQTDLGLPLHLQSEVIESSKRSTVQQTYDQLLLDLAVSKQLLPGAVDELHPNRASRPAAMALLARAYLSMGAYHLALLHADSCLQLRDQLLDYNEVSKSSSFPFKRKNPEILYVSRISGFNMLVALLAQGTIVDSALYQLYDPLDLRRSLFYSINSIGKPILKSSYTGDVFLFAGLATDEMFLIRAECFVRARKKVAAIHDLNTLLSKRWSKGAFVPIPDTTNDSVLLHRILEERRKELAFRNLRWTDIRRLNKEGAALELTRLIQGQIYTLPPNDLRYVLPIPPDVIALSNMPQNPR